MRCCAGRGGYVDGRPHAGEEQVGLQVDLSVGDRNHVGRNVRRDFAFQRLDDRQGGHRTAAQLVAELGRPFQQPAVAVEHVAGIRLAAGRTTHQQRQLPIRAGLLGQVVVDDQRVLPLLHEVFGHRRAGVRERCTAAGPDRSRPALTTIV